MDWLDQCSRAARAISAPSRGWTVVAGRSGIGETVFRKTEAAVARGRTLVVAENQGTISRFSKVSQGKIATASSTEELVSY